MIQQDQIPTPIKRMQACMTFLTSQLTEIPEKIQIRLCSLLMKSARAISTKLDELLKDDTLELSKTYLITSIKTCLSVFFPSDIAHLGCQSIYRMSMKLRDYATRCLGDAVDKNTASSLHTNLLQILNGTTSISCISVSQNPILNQGYADASTPTENTNNLDSPLDLQFLIDTGNSPSSTFKMQYGIWRREDSARSFFQSLQLPDQDFTIKIQLKKKLEGRYQTLNSYTFPVEPTMIPKVLAPLSPVIMKCMQQEKKYYVQNVGKEAWKKKRFHE